MRGRSADGTRSSWDSLGRWASHDTDFRRTSQGSQPDDLGTVATDTWKVPGLTSWQVRVTLLREAGSTATPRLDAVGAMVSRLPATADVATSAPGVARGTVLVVPTFSQMVHQGHYPQWGGGGQAWCSPTSLAMVLRYYRALPPKKQTAWAGDHGARVVDHLARMTYDYGYRGTGNWPFNTAYATTRVQQAFVTRLASLRDERNRLPSLPRLRAELARAVDSRDDAALGEKTQQRGGVPAGQFVAHVGLAAQLDHRCQRQRHRGFRRALARQPVGAADRLLERVVARAAAGHDDAGIQQSGKIGSARPVGGIDVKVELGLGVGVQVEHDIGIGRKLH